MTARTTIEVQNVVLHVRASRRAVTTPGARPLATFYAELLGLHIAHRPRQPAALAGFHAALLDLPEEELDTPERVVVARADRRLPAPAFQHAQVPAPRWHDPGVPCLLAARELADRLFCP